MFERAHEVAYSLLKCFQRRSRLLTKVFVKLPAQNLSKDECSDVLQVQSQIDRQLHQIGELDRKTGFLQQIKSTARLESGCIGFDELIKATISLAQSEQPLWARVCKIRNHHPVH